MLSSVVPDYTAPPEDIAPPEQAFEPVITVRKKAKPALTFPMDENKYPVVKASDVGLDDYFKKNTNVAGMAWGGGLNGSPKEQQRSVVINPYSPNLKNEQAVNSLISNERIRHSMDESQWEGDFDITPEQKKWAKNLGAYANDEKALRQTIVARIASGDRVPNPTKDQLMAAQQFKTQ